MGYQDRLETNLLQLFPHQPTSEWFSIISAIIFAINVVAAQKQAQVTIFFVFYKLPLPSTLLLPCPTTVPASLCVNIKKSNHNGGNDDFLLNCNLG